MSDLNLYDLVNGAEVILSEITKHPEIIALNYHSDLTIGDALSALSYLKFDLLSQQSTNNPNGIK